MKADSRIKSILAILLQNDRFVTVTQIAERLQVSNRTIRNDLAVLDGLLSSQGVQLIRKAGKGSRLEAPPSAKLALKTLFAEKYPETKLLQGLSPLGRQRILLLSLLDAQAPVTVAALEKLLFISRATVFSDLAAVELTLARYKLSLQRKKGCGMALLGKERHVRTCLLDTLQQDSAFKSLTALFKDEAIPDCRLFPLLQLDSRFLRNYFKEVRLLNLDYLHNLSVQSACSVLLRVFISARRFAQGRTVELSAELLKSLQSASGVGELQKLIRPIERHFAINFTETEYRYFQVFFLASNRNYLLQPSDRRYVRRLSQSMIEHWSAYLGLPLHDDSLLQNALDRSLLPILTRFIFGIRMENPLLEDIRRAYGPYFAPVAESLAQAERRYGQQSLDEEVGFLVLNLVAALKRRIKPFKALLVCHSEEAVTSLLKQEISSQFAAVHIEQTLSIYSFRSCELNAFDLIISSAALDFDGSIPLVVVHPILTGEDYKRLWEVLNSLCRQKYPICAALPDED